MQTALMLLILLFTASAMLAVGLDSSAQEVARVFRQRRFMLRAMLAVLLAVPLLGALLVELAAPPPPVASGIMLVTLSPGAAFALQFTRKREEAARAVALQLLFALIALVVTPLAVRWLVPGSAPIHLRTGRILALVIAVTLPPLLAGFELRRRRPELARKLRRPVAICVGASFLLVFWVLLRPVKAQARLSVGHEALLLMLLLVLASMAMGWFLGGPKSNTRAVLATHASVRNSAIALLIADQGFADPLVRQTVIAYAAVMMPPNFVLMLLLGYAAKRRRGAHVDDPAQRPAS
jgi:predicted Na+-dependent transporter